MPVNIMAKLGNEASYSNITDFWIRMHHERGFTFKGFLVLDDVWMAHVSQNCHLFTRFLPFFVRHLIRKRRLHVYIKEDIPSNITFHIQVFNDWNTHYRWYEKSMKEKGSTHPGDANLLDNILSAICPWLDQDGFPKGSLPNLFQPLIFFHVWANDFSCWGRAKHMKLRSPVKQY